MIPSPWIGESLRVLFIGCVKMSETLLEVALQTDGIEVVGLITKKSSAQNADFTQLEPLAANNGIPTFYFSTTEPENAFNMEVWIREQKADIIFCFGWSHLLPNSVLKLAPRGVVGFHPAALPANRGRHPLIWALALGLKETASTFFFMDGGADSGPILSQKKISISGDDDAQSLYEKVATVAATQLKELGELLVKGQEKPIPQDDKFANVWRKRGKEDGKIDWRMSAKCIHNLVRALAKPYVGAHVVHAGIDVKVWKTRIGANEFLNFEPGRVLAIEGKSVCVKCGEGTLWILDHEFSTLPQDYV